MGDESSGNCRTWEEDVYWKRFHSVRFLQFLPNDFHQRLMLPKKFTDNMTSHLPEKVVLKGPDGAAWNVKLLNYKGESVVLTGNGWQEFVEAYTLQSKDLLIFKYDRKECFEVLIFNQKSLCEREASYFVKKCQQQPERKGECDRQAKRRTSEYVSDTSQEDRDECEFVPTKKPKRNTRNNRSLEDYSSDHTTQARDGSDVDDSNKHRVSREQKSIPKRKKSLEMNGIQKKASRGSVDHNSGRKVPCNGSWKRKTHTGERDESKGSDDQVKSISEKHNSGIVNGTAGKRDSPRSPACDRVRKLRSLSLKKGKSNTVGTSHPKVNRKGVCYKSNRRPVTEAEKEKAYDMALRNITHGCFLVIMRPSSVYYRFNLIIPAEWKAKSMLKGNQEVILRVKDNTWVTNFCPTINHGNGGFGGGWKKFALDNFLEEFDVCLFQPADEKSGSFIIDVSIFRVVQEITPLSPGN